MLRKSIFTFIFSLVVALFLLGGWTNSPQASCEEWGFFGHRKINRYAVFTLPQDMMPLYKKNIQYLEEHAVDPDKRRYATKFEAIRHYIDIDHWDTFPFDKVPRTYGIAVTKYSDWILIDEQGDSTYIDKMIDTDSIALIVNGEQVLKDSYKKFEFFFSKDLSQCLYEEECILEGYTIDVFFNTNFSSKYKSFKVVDKFSDYGILPYHLIRTQRELTRAFLNKDANKVIRLSSDFGHYIGDAHVPLHTTENYNGQLSNQVGIHAFWESRIPELFAEAEYDFFAGKATKINDIEAHYWNIVLESHKRLDEVLTIEKQLSLTFPSDRQYCYDERLGNTIRIQCPEYAKAYSDAMQGMVEERMIASIKAIGDAWYTAWVDAGQPKLEDGSFIIEDEEIIVNPNIKVRAHDN